MLEPDDSASLTAEVAQRSIFFGEALEDFGVLWVVGLGNQSLVVFE